jgi:hypothetical protein
VKYSLEKQKHFTQRREVLQGAKEKRHLFFANLCALAPLREIVHSFTASQLPPSSASLPFYTAGPGMERK